MIGEIFVKKEIYKRIAALEGLTTYHYKVILLLLGGSEYTQVQMADMLGSSKQNINKVCQNLYHQDIVLKKRSEGRSVYWGINPKPSFQMVGQLKLEA